MRRHRQEYKPLTEINVTNLLDTAFVLLMAFMIVAPAIKHGIELDLPTVEGGATIENIDNKKTVTVIIEKKRTDDGSEWIYVEDRRLSLTELSNLIRSKKSEYPEIDVVLEADRDVRYESFAQALNAIKEGGVSDVGLVTQPPEESAAPSRQSARAEQDEKKP